MPDPHRSGNLRSMMIALEKLKSGKLSWGKFFQLFSPLDPSLRLVTTKEGDTILHVAVWVAAPEIPREWLYDRSLFLKRNMYGLTPEELARFLRREKLFQQIEEIPFHLQPGVTVFSQKPLNIGFLAQPVFENPHSFSQVLTSSFRAKQKDRVPPEKTWMGVYFDKEIQQGMTPQVAIRFIDDEVGFGVFSMQRIPACSYVGEYTGLVQEKKPKHVRDKRYCVRYTVWEMERCNFVIDAETMGNFTRFINHSATPNLSLQSVYWRGMPRMIFIALKEIEEGTQFTFDYGTFFWETCEKSPKPF